MASLRLDTGSSASLSAVQPIRLYPQDMRILHVVPHVQNIGNGIVNSTIDLAIEQASLGVEVAVAGEGGEYKDLLAKSGITHHSLSMSPRSVPALRHLMTHWKPSIIHAHTPKATVLARFTSPFTPLVATAHNEFSKGKYLLRVADRIITVSEQNQQSISRWAGKGRTRMVRNGVLGGARTISQVSTDGADLEHPAIVFVGGMNERKGVRELLEALESVVLSVPKVKLYLVGDGPKMQAFKALASAMNLSGNVEFVGFDAAPYKYMISADIFVLPSRSEPFGLVLAEARQAGCAIIATNVGGIPDVLEGGRAGRLVPANDSATLGREIVSLLLDDEARSRMAAKAKLGLDWLRVSRVENETRDIYHELI